MRYARVKDVLLEKVEITTEVLEQHTFENYFLIRANNAQD